MTNTRLLSLILRETNNLITSSEYKEAYSLGNEFSRNRKLSFSNTVHFICSALRKSISSEMDDFIEEHTYLNFHIITKQAFSKARQHIESIGDKFSLHNSIVIFDRGYPSYDMFDYLNNKGLLFLMRVSTSFKLAQAVDSDDSILKYKLNGEIKKVRVLKIKLSEEVTEVLVTKIYDKKITPIEFKELYFLRWGIESKYKELKSSIKIEEFSGTKPVAIEQDFYASIYLSMIAALIKKEADAAIANENKDKALSSAYQSNRNFILGQVFKRIIKLLVKFRLRNKILESILEKAIKIRSQVRCNRSCERKTNIQGKSTIIILNPAFSIKDKYIIQNSLYPVDLFSIPFLKENLNKLVKNNCS